MPSRASELRGFLLGQDARLKLCAALLGWLCVLSAARPALPLGVAACALGSLAACGVSPRSVLRPLGAGLFTALVAVLLRVLLTEGGPELELAPFGVPVRVNEAGLQAAALLGARILGAVSIAAWLTATTPWRELTRALAWLRVPAALLEVLSLTRRYVSVLKESMDTARSAQTLRLGYRGFGRSLRSAGALAGLTLARAFDQSVATDQAQRLRGFK